MSADALRLELAALARLVPELNDLAAKMKRVPGGAVAPAAAESPTMGAARSITADAIPAVRAVLADRFATVGDRVHRAYTQFREADEDRASVITGNSAHTEQLSPAVLA